MNCTHKALLIQGLLAAGDRLVLCIKADDVMQYVHRRGQSLALTPPVTSHVSVFLGRPLGTGPGGPLGDPHPCPY